MMWTADQVKQLLEGMDLEDPKVEILEPFGRKLLIGVISPSYERMNEGERQALVWDKLLDAIGDDATRWVEFVYTDSPTEALARRSRGEVAESR